MEPSRRHRGGGDGVIVQWVVDCCCFFVWNDGKVLETGNGDGYTELLKYFMPLTRTLKSG